MQTPKILKKKEIKYGFVYRNSQLGDTYEIECFLRRFNFYEKYSRSKYGLSNIFIATSAGEIFTIFILEQINRFTKLVRH